MCALAEKNERLLLKFDKMRHIWGFV